MSEQPVSDQVPPRRSWAWPTVAIVFILVGGGLVGFGVMKIAGWPAALGNGVKDFVADAMRPKQDVREFVSVTVTEVQRKNKLVVLTTTINTDVTRQEGSKSWGIYWGTNVARVQVTDARVQYCIDLSSIGTADFSYDEGQKLLTVTVPRPRIDKDMVSIDPAKIQTLDLSGGWMRWDKRDTWEHAVAELLPKVIQQAQGPLVQKEAEESGKEAIMGLLTPQAQALRSDGVTLVVRYRD